MVKILLKKYEASTCKNLFAFVAGTLRGTYLSWDPSGSQNGLLLSQIKISSLLQLSGFPLTYLRLNHSFVQIIRAICGPSTKTPASVYPSVLNIVEWNVSIEWANHGSLDRIALTSWSIAFVNYHKYDKALGMSITMWSQLAFLSSQCISNVMKRDADNSK
jgi:hypothetical protein